MDKWEIIRMAGQGLTALASILAAVKAWAANGKADETRKLVVEIRQLFQQNPIQTQVQSPQININVGTTQGNAKQGKSVTFADEE